MKIVAWGLCGDMRPGSLKRWIWKIKDLPHIDDMPSSVIDKSSPCVWERLTIPKNLAAFSVFIDEWERKITGIEILSRSGQVQQLGLCDLSVVKCSFHMTSYEAAIKSTEVLTSLRMGPHVRGESIAIQLQTSRRTFTIGQPSSFIDIYQAQGRAFAVAFENRSEYGMPCWTRVAVFGLQTPVIEYTEHGGNEPLTADEMLNSSRKMLVSMAKLQNLRAIECYYGVEDAEVISGLKMRYSDGPDHILGEDRVRGQVSTIEATERIKEIRVHQDEFVGNKRICGLDFVLSSERTLNLGRLDNVQVVQLTQLTEDSVLVWSFHQSCTLLTTQSSDNVEGSAIMKSASAVGGKQ